MNVTFGEEIISQHFLVEDVRRSILPERENYSIEVPNRHGSYYAGHKYKERPIEVDIIIISEDIDTVKRELAWMLDITEPTTLLFSDEPSRYWRAVLDGSTNLDEILQVGKGTLTFLCHDPFAYSTLEKNYNGDANNLLTINNAGTAPVSPKFEVQFNADSGFAAFVSPNGVIQLGNPKEVDTIPLTPSERKIDDSMAYTGTPTGGWVTNTNGKSRFTTSIQGSYTGDGGSVAALNFATATSAWHGPTLRHDIGLTGDGSSSAANWETSCTFQFRAGEWNNTNANREIGAFEFEIMDESNNFLAGFVMKDVNEGMTFNIPQFWVGNTLIWQDNPDIMTAKSLQQFNPVTGKYELKNLDGVNFGKWNNFYGRVILRRIGREFYFELQKINQFNNEVLTTDRVIKVWYDTADTYLTTKAKTVNIFSGKYKTYSPLEWNRIDYVAFYKHNVNSYVDVPNLFGAGDTLNIDCDKSLVTLNGAIFMDRLDVGSEFFQLLEGETEVQFLHSNFPGTAPTVSAKITERFL